MITADTFDNREPSEVDLVAARLELGKLIAEAFMAERDAAGRTAPPRPAPREPRLNRHERRRLAALARKS